MKKSRLFQKITALCLALGLVLSLLIAVVGFVPITAQPVSAATQPQEEIIETGLKSVKDTENAKSGKNTDGYFQFSEGGGIRFDPDRITFQVNQIKDTYDSKMEWWDETSAISFTLYRELGKKSSPVCEVLIFNVRKALNVVKCRTYTQVLFKYYENPSYNAEDYIFSMNPYPLNGDEFDTHQAYVNAPWANSVYMGGLKGTSYDYKDCKKLSSGFRTIDEHTNPFHFNRTDESYPALQISFPVKGSLDAYFVKVEYEIDLVNDSGMDRKGSFTSNAYSVYDMLKRIESAGALEKEFTDAAHLERARSIIDDGNRTDVTIEYLEELDGGLLAVEKQATVRVPVRNGKIELGDVCAAMGWTSHKCLEANVAAINQDKDTGIYKFEYNYAMDLRVRTEDGGVHTYDTFLSINSSYKEYYDLIKGAFEDQNTANGLYSFLWQQLVDQVESLGEYSAAEMQDKIHGYFGVMWIPNRSMLSSFNTLMADMFNVRTETAGLISKFDTPIAIDSGEYNKLMSTFNYTWIASLWDQTQDFLNGEKSTAQFYFFAVKPTKDNIAVISKTGSSNHDDDDGAGGEVIEDIGNGIDDFFDELFAGGQDTATTVKRLASLLVLAAIVVACMWGYGQVKGIGKRK